MNKERNTDSTDREKREELGNPTSEVVCDANCPVCFSPHWEEEDRKEAELEADE